MQSLEIPRVIGHRGAAGHAPENTLAALRRAAALGVRMVEFDAKLSADLVPVLMHDETLERTTDGAGAVADAPLSALAALDAGSWYDAAHAGEPVPTLAVALKAALGLGLAVNIEIKPCPGRERETARRVLEAARALWPAERPPPLVSSFSVEALAEARASAPDWPRGWLIWDRPEDWRRVLSDLAPATLNVAQDRETPERIAEYRAAGLPVLAYTVNHAGRARQLLALGIAALFTDFPDRLAGL